MKTKQVILIRKDLKMRRGKEIAQGSHASMEFLVTRLRSTRRAGDTFYLDDRAIAWIENGAPKICLRVQSEEELVALHERARSLGLKSYLIRDSGRTEFSGIPTLTACAIGPDLSDDIDRITGDLVPY